MFDMRFSGNKEIAVGSLWIWGGDTLSVFWTVSSADLGAHHTRSSRVSFDADEILEMFSHRKFGSVYGFRVVCGRTSYGS